MTKIEIFGKSCVFGFIGRRFRFHYTSAERVKRIDDLIFRIHPKDNTKRMAKADFKNGFTVCVVPTESEGRRYYNVEILSKGRPIREGSDLRNMTASYCSEDTVNGILEYYQTK